METPSQTYERVTGKKWTGGTSADIQSAYKQYGITAPAGSAQANLALQKALQSGSGSNMTDLGGGLMVPKGSAAETNYNNNIKTPTVISSNQARTGVTDAQNKLNDLTNKQNTTTTQTTEKGPAPANTTTTQSDPLQSKVDEINQSAESEIAAAETLFNNSIATLDANQVNTINSIKETYRKRKEEMDRLNKATLGGKRVSGIVSGRDRYAQDFQTDVLSREEQDGIQRLADLDTQERQLIEEAKAARDENQMQALYENMSKISAINKAKVDQINSLYKNAMDMEKLAMDKAKEQRDQVKDDIANMEKYSENIAASLIDSFTGDAKKDQELVNQAALEYNLDPNFISQAIAEYKIKQQQASPSDLRLYDELVRRGEYKGSFLNFQKTLANAKKVASGAGSANQVLTRDEATRWQLPEELIGKSDKQIIEDLLVTRVPDWFKKSQVSSGNISAAAPASEFQNQWNSFRSQPDMKIYTGQLDLIKAGAKETNAPALNDAEEIVDPFA